MLFEKEITDEAMKNAIHSMAVAARTAPKARGRDNIIIAVAEKDDILKISEKMKEIGTRTDASFFIRDAENILQANYMLIVAAKINATDLPYCGLCGFENCNEKRKQPTHPCAFNTIDLGIAIGSAVSMAAELKADNRVLYTAGMAVKELKLMGEEAEIILCIPITNTSKNPFFDRK